MPRHVAATSIQGHSIIVSSLDFKEHFFLFYDIGLIHHLVIHHHTPFLPDYFVTIGPLTKIRLVKAMVFPVFVYGCELDYKKAERRRIDAFELWCWRRLLKVPWGAKRSKQSILKKISPEYSLEGLMLKLKLQYFGHLMQRTDSLEKTLIGKD